MKVHLEFFLKKQFQKKFRKKVHEESSRNNIQKKCMKKVQEIHPCPYKRTGDISVSPVHQQQFLVARPVFSGNFPRFSQCFSVKNAKKLSPVLSCSKIGRPSCKLLFFLFNFNCHKLLSINV